MGYLETYINKIKARGNEALAESVSKTAEEVGSQHLNNFDFVSHEIGLLLGNVQSGKTGQMFGIMCKAADLGFPVFLLLTTDNVVLQQQTLQRVKEDLEGFCICGENDSRLFVDSNLEQPAIVVLKKNARMLKLWDTVFHSTDFMLGNPLFIVDDEADAASLNTKVNQQDVSSINKYLNSIKNDASSSLYLQVTGTPQALFLQAEATGWKPLFTHYFKPGKAYMGGDFFFPVNADIPPCIRLLDDIPSEDDALQEAVIHHLIASAQMLLAGKPVCNFMIHPSVRVASHNQYANEAEKILARLTADFDQSKIQEAFKAMYDQSIPQKSDARPLDEVMAYVRELLTGQKVSVNILNGKNEVDSSEYSQGSNIVIGGNTLGRGVTFPGLATVYYTRTSKNPQADTMWQHSRMFGYDRDPGLIRLYIDGQLFDLFTEINATNNALIAQIEKGLPKIHLFYAGGIKPTRANVLDKKRVNIIPGGKNFFPQIVDNTDIEAIDKLLAPFDDKKDTYQANLRVMRRVLDYITTEDFPLEAFKGFMDAFSAQNPTAQGVLIVRRERDIKRGGRALLSPDDWNLGASITDKVVLTMYKMTGNKDKGWEGRKVWVPNIKLPDEAAYYDVDED
ncbi:Z1 domain-containing protein [Selenomonas sp. FC4001]|uniref:Z1 domain-containing protein n=1 Tax=Selenomonas sp. FC4001 TaxID=1408313 RepID=UPI0005629327|nr:Z1 domain-containing protein [Selenomonas sp. FC4001]